MVSMRPESARPMTRALGKRWLVRWICVFGGLAALAAAGEAPVTAVFDADGALSFHPPRPADADPAAPAPAPAGFLRPVVHPPGWTPLVLEPDPDAGDAGKLPGARGLRAKTPDGRTLCVTATCRVPAGGRAIHYELVCAARDDLTLEDVVAAFEWPASAMAGRAVQLDAKTVTLPEVWGKEVVLDLDERARSLRAASPGLGTIDFFIDPARKTVLQDDRQWADQFSVRIVAPGEKTWKAGEIRTISLTLTFAGDIVFRDALFPGAAPPRPTPLQPAPADAPASPPATAEQQPAKQAAPPPSPSPAPAPVPAPATAPVSPAKPVAAESEPGFVMRAGAGWIPLKTDCPGIVEGSALDFSGFSHRHEPAGKFGRLRVDPALGRFVFEQDSDKLPRRFHGVNFCYDAQFLSGNQPERIASRLARLGYNAVRLHHFDGKYDWIDLAFTDPAREQGASIDAHRLDQFDRFFAAMKMRGLYVSLDLLCSRQVPARALWPDAGDGEPPVPLATAAQVNDRAFDNWAAFVRNLLSHKNPYTGLRYADDPALAWICLVNEGNASNFLKDIIGGRPRERADWTRAWNAWLAARAAANPEQVRRAGFEGDPAAGTTPFAFGPDSYFYHVETAQTAAQLALLREFFAERERETFARMRSVVAELDCAALLTNQNGWMQDPLSPIQRADYDYVDDHAYLNLTQPVGAPRDYRSLDPVIHGQLAGLDAAWIRMAGKPFTLSEYNHSVPDPYRTFTGLATPAFAALQDWDGLWRFAYSHGRLSKDGALPLFEPSPALHTLDMVTDPVSMLTERAAICLFARGDMPPAPAALLVRGSADDFRAANAWWSKPHLAAASPEARRLALGARVALLLEGPGADIALKAFADAPVTVDPQGLRAPGAEDRLLDELAERGWPAARRVREAKPLAAGGRLVVTEAFRLDPEARSLTLDTLRTAGGRAPAGGELRAQAARWRVGGADAAVWASALDGDKPLSSARRILLVHATDAVGDGTGFADASRKTLTREGGMPWLMRAGRAELELVRAADAPVLKCWALDYQGARLAEVPVDVREGRLRLSLSIAGSDPEDAARCFYELAPE